MFFELSPYEIVQRLFLPMDLIFAPVKFRKNIDDLILDQVSLFKMTEIFLNILQREKQITLTKTGALPQKFLKEINNYNLIKNDWDAVTHRTQCREDDFPFITSARITLDIARLTKIRHGKLSLTQSGIKLLEKKRRQELFELFFRTFVEEFNWSYNDGYPDNEVGQLGWNYNILLLNQLGDEACPAHFYAEHYRRLFPSLMASFMDVQYATPEKVFADCYRLRTFERFLVWFGLAKEVVEEKPQLFSERQYLSTELLRSIFEMVD